MEGFTLSTMDNKTNGLATTQPAALTTGSDGGFRATLATGFSLVSGAGLVLAAALDPALGVGVMLTGAVLSLVSGTSVRLVKEWERLVVLRLGKFEAVKSPGITFLIPVLDQVAACIDTRVQVTPFVAQQTLTRDTVPVDVDAVLFWYVFDVKKASLEVADFKLAVSWAAQTALRDMIGRSLLAQLLSERGELEKYLQQAIDERTAAWGVQIQAVEVRDVQIPTSLQDAMSREAQAEREKKARVILSEAEMEIAANFVSAAEQYKTNPTALTLRGWNIIREGLKEKGNVVLIPTDTLNSLGSAGSALSMKQWLDQQAKNEE